MGMVLTEDLMMFHLTFRDVRDVSMTAFCMTLKQRCLNIGGESLNYLDLVGDSGMVCNIEKLQFSEPIVESAGFCISPDTVEPTP